MVPILTALVITSPFGQRVDPFDASKPLDNHMGVDLRANNEALCAPETGTVIATGSDAVSGMYVKYQPMGRDFILSFCHLSAVLCKAGDSLKEGKAFAVTGNTGRSTAPHLHLTMRRLTGELVDPTSYVLEMQSAATAKVLLRGGLSGMALVLIVAGIAWYIAGR